MPRFPMLIFVLSISGCTDHPDPTTSAIDMADRTGGICSSDSVIFEADRAITHYDCEDRALRGISALVFNAPE